MYDGTSEEDCLIWQSKHLIGIVNVLASAIYSVKCIICCCVLSMVVNSYPS